MKISERGQVTIPKELRDKLGLTPHTEIRFVLRDGTLRIEKDPGERRAAVERMYGAKDLGRGTDEIMRLLRG